MSKRGREFAQLMANRHAELYGLEKAHGASLAETYLPLGEGVAVVEKAVKQAGRNAKRQRAAADTLAVMLAHSGEAIRREGEALARIEALYRASPVPERRFQDYTMGSHPMQIPEVNGHSFNGEN